MRYQIKETAKAEVAADFGHTFAFSVLAVVDQNRSYRMFAPVGEHGPIAHEAKPLFEDQVEEIR